jgi:hypothetical protein
MPKTSSHLQEFRYDIQQANQQKSGALDSVGIIVADLNQIELLNMRE